MNYRYGLRHQTWSTIKLANKSIIIFFFFLNYFYYFYLFVYGSVHVSAGDYAEVKGVICTWSWSYEAVSCSMWALGTKVRSSAKAMNTFDCWIFSTTPISSFKKKCVSVPVCESMPTCGAAPMETRRGHHIPWSWNYWCFQVVQYGWLRAKLWSSWPTRRTGNKELLNC